MKTGDERYLPARDQGPVRRFVRDFVDARFSFVELMMPLLVVTLILGYSGNAHAGDVRATSLLLAMLLLVIVDLRPAAVPAAPRARPPLPRRAAQGHHLLRRHARAADAVHAAAQAAGQDRPDSCPSSYR